MQPVDGGRTHFAVCYNYYVADTAEEELVGSLTARNGRLDLYVDF